MFQVMNVKPRSKTLIAGAIAAATLSMTGCASKIGGGLVEEGNKDIDTTTNTVIDSVTSSWNASPGIQMLDHLDGEGISIHGPVDVPDAIGEKHVALEFHGQTSINDLVEALALEGVNVIPVSNASASPAPQQGATNPVAASMDGESTPDDQLVTAIQGAAEMATAGARRSNVADVGSQTFRLPRFNGTVRELLDVISMMTDISFKGRGNYILARQGIEYYVDLPQDEELVKRVAGDLEALGANNVVTSIDAGSVTFNSGASRDHVLRDYMERLERNNAMIGLQVAVVSVSHDRDRNTGVDWSALQATIGNASLSNGNNGVPNGGVPDGGGESGDADGSRLAAGEGDNSSPTTGLVSSAANRISGVVNSSNLSLAYLGGDFELRGLINMLSRYGTTETKQNLVLRTLSANSVKIRSGQSTPYVSEIDVSSTGDTLTGGTETDVAETGLTLEITPYYNDKTGLVTMNVDLDMSSIISFINLSAGDQVGQLTQPDIQEQSFSNAARLMAGETVILGGISYDQITADGNTLTPLESLDLDDEQYSRQQNSLFVVLRPTVTIYE
ncbi:type II secretion system protein GspD [Vreelandella massiliensis]|uniref:type II secretion system protein GspD n=1 Tax=Vreelandella massiliensis TaxID=1816686 RepID=UPI001181C20B|nr:hypothetical protein [Halomonas massiliensis]